MSPIDPAALRAHFPALASGTIFLENAGGSHVPESVIDVSSGWEVEDLYLASDAARLVNGTELVIDGGFTAQ